MQNIPPHSFNLLPTYGHLLLHINEFMLSIAGKWTIKKH